MQIGLLQHVSMDMLLCQLLTRQGWVMWAEKSHAFYCAKIYLLRSSLNLLLGLFYPMFTGDTTPTCHCQAMGDALRVQKGAMIATGSD